MGDNDGNHSNNSNMDSNMESNHSNMSTVGSNYIADSELSSTSTNSASDDGLEPMLDTDQYPMEPIVAYSPMNMARAVHFTDSQHILTASGTTHVAPNVPRRKHVER